MKLKPALISAILTAVFFTGIAWVKNSQDELHTGNQVFEGPVDIRGTFSLNGTPITVSAADLNYANTGVPVADFTNMQATVATALQPADITNLTAKAETALQPGAIAAAPTNAVAHGLTLTINGTNYVVQLFPVN